MALKTSSHRSFSDIMRAVGQPHALSYKVVIFAFIIACNILVTLEIEFRLVPVESINRAGPSLGKMKRIRNSGHILCLKEPEHLRQYCEKVFVKLPKLASTYNLTDAKQPKELAYRIVYTAGNGTPEVVFACGCPTEPPGLFLMGWVNPNPKATVIEVLDYQYAKTDRLDPKEFKTNRNESVLVERMRKHFMANFTQGEKFLLKRYDEAILRNDADAST